MSEPDFETDKEWDAISFVNASGTKRFLVSRAVHWATNADDRLGLSVEIWLDEDDVKRLPQYGDKVHVSYNISYNDFAQIIQHVLTLAEEGIKD